MFKLNKILIILLILLIINLIGNFNNVWSISIDEILSSGEEFIKIGDEEAIRIDETKLSNISSNVFNIFLAAGIIIAIAVGIVLGIKFMTSGIEGQAKVKEALIPYFVGCIVIFGAFTIWKITVNIGESVDNIEYTSDTGEADALNRIEQLKKGNATLGQLIDEYTNASRNYRPGNDRSDYYESYQQTIRKELENILKKYINAEEVGKAIGYYVDYANNRIGENYFINEGDQNRYYELRQRRPWS